MSSDERGASSWRGEWITADDIPEPGRLHRVGFRREIELDSVPGTLPVRITADARYVLWVNGSEIGRGPVRSQPARWTYDEHDIAPALRRGRNAIAVLVTYYGEDNAFWQRARVTAGLGSRACLLVDAGEAWPELATDTRWRGHTLRAWSSEPSGGILASLPIEVVDHRLLDPAWTVSPHYLASMADAVTATAAHPGGRNRSRPPAYPYGPLRPRGMAPLGGDLVTPASVCRAHPVTGAPGAPVTGAHEIASRVTAWIDAGGPLPDPVEAEAGDLQVWRFDFGRVVSGFAEIDVLAPAGSLLDVAYLERSGDDRADGRYTPRAGARVVLGDGRTSFRALEPNGLRYALLVITPARRGTVHVSGMSVREHLYPRREGPAFWSSDPDLERLWRAGVRTTQLNSVDAFTDCPTREQRAWVGDAVVHTEVHLVANADWRLIARHLELSDSPRPDGLLPMSVAGDIEAAAMHSIPDWSLHWLHALWLYARSCGDVDAIRAHLATAGRMLAWFTPYADADGILRDVPEWPLVDWSSVFTSGHSSILTALWARGLREYAELSRWAGNTGDAAEASAWLSLVEEGFDRFWDAERGLYVDHAEGTERLPPVSQAANAAAIVAGLVPVDRLEGIIERITDERRLVTRGWNAASPTIALEDKIADRARGVQRIDWDVHTEIVRAEPFFSAVVHDAVARAGRADLIPALVRRWLRFLEDGYDTFGECWEWGSPSHGWSSSPARDLVVHVLGVRPLDLGSDTYTVSPARTGLDRIGAAVPTRRGIMRVEVVGSTLRVRTPVAVQVLTWEGDTVRRSPGEHVVELRRVAPGAAAREIARQEGA
ncbi:hypothetical protein [Microbacterium sp. 18062]|uniref:alpha-L-rhamnosidase-related protein n=1 Tax=Microbacterium sp. 18062 TaxID=2681410 RepID=UPI0013580009|nr:hypothetical protein [Microbacterium sp. 18062]